MIERMGDRGSTHDPHGTPPWDCDHPGEDQHHGHDGEIRCSRCWRVWRLYPSPLGWSQAIWHYAHRTIIAEDLHRFGGRGGTI